MGPDPGNPWPVARLKTISASGSTTIASIANEPMAFSMVARADVTWEDYRTATHRMRRPSLTIP
jgi:hypothetical protein